jgi:hypothetical protein
MSSADDLLAPLLLKRGTYSRPTESDLRSPCPMINCLANHGYIPRDGRNVRIGCLKGALKEAGASTVLAAAFSNAIFLEHTQSDASDATSTKPPQSFLGRLWYLVRNPLAILFSRFGVRRPGQNDSMGKPYLDLDQIGLYGAVEHDVSLSRNDYAQGDNFSPQPELIKEILESSSDGGKTLTIEDLAGLRKRRIEKQKQINLDIQYGNVEHQLGCGEIALILGIFGDGSKVRCDYVRAFFAEERLPVAEGWKKRWWTFGLVELKRSGAKVRKLIGLKF